MTWTYLGNGIYFCNESDTKDITNVTANSLCIEVHSTTHYIKHFIFDGEAWIETVSSAGSTSLAGDTDVTITTPAQYHILQYGAGTDWVNALIDNNNIAASAGIAKSKLAALAIADADVASNAAIAKSKLAALGIVDADVASNAAISKSKLAALAIADADVATNAGIAKSKLAALGIVDADVASNAGIAKSKLAALEIADADVASNAAIAVTKIAKGTALQVIRTNAGGTANEWASLNSENVGTATGSANGSATVFTIAHGLGSTPYMVMVGVSSVLGSTISRSWSYDATNITVTFATAPTTGTITFQWIAVL